MGCYDHKLMRESVKLRDVAARAGVHPSTVSRALDPTKSGLVSSVTRARVIAVADELGYQADAVARGLRRGRTNSVGVVVADMGNPFIAPVISGGREQPRLPEASSPL